MEETTQQEDRRREHPSERFDFREKLFDLGELSEKIENESLSESHNEQGHQQIALIRDLPETLALYRFEQGGTLVDHSVNGAVTIHVMEGQLTVSTDESDHELGPGKLLVLNEGVEHNVKADQESLALVTISWRGE